MENFISTKEAATKLDVSVSRVLALVRGGRLKATKIGEGKRATYLIPADLEAVRVRKPGRPAKPPAEPTPPKKRGRPRKPLPELPSNI